MTEKTEPYGNSNGDGDPHASSGEELASFGVRVTEIVGNTPLRAFASLADVDPKSLRAYMEGQSEPSRAALIRLARAGNVSVAWLATGEGSKEPDGPVKDRVDIPLYDVRAAAGLGKTVFDELVVGTRAFSRSWIELRLRMRPADLALVVVHGDSMQPTLHDGDLIMANIAETQLSRDGIYLLRDGDELMVKRLQRVPGGRFRVISDNQQYASVEYDAVVLQQGALALVGRVIWWAHTDAT